MKLRSWVLFAALGAGLMGCALAQAPHQTVPGQEAMLKLSSGPYTKYLAKNSVTIVWHTTQKSSSTVAWGKSESYGMKTNGEAGVTHKVKLSGLSGGTTYHYRVVSKSELEEVSSEDQSFSTLFADLSVRSAQFPSSLAVGLNYTVPVTTFLGSQPLDKPYAISIYRTAYSQEGLLLMENVKVGSATVWPHNPNTYRTTNVPITLSVLKKGRRGMQEAFSTRSVFTVKAEAAEPEENLSNNQLTREVPVTH